MKLIQTLSKGFYKHLKLIWVVMSIILLILLLYYNWHRSLNHSQKAISEIANALSNQVDGFFETLLQEVYTLPVEEGDLDACSEGLLDQLQRITLNHPFISGLVVSDKNHKLLCSTLPKEKIYIAKSNQTRSLTGPYALALYDQPIYLLQQRLGNYKIGIILISSLVEKVLQTPNKLASTIGLYHLNTKKNIVSISRKLNNKEWHIDNALGQNLIQNQETLIGNSMLQSIDGIAVIAVENPKQLLRNLYSSQAIVGVVFLLFSTFMYFLVKNMFTKRYSLQTLMKLALKNNEFYPVYQPIFDKEKGHYSGAEVLLRWQDELEEIILPDFFIQEAESSGLIIPITLAIIATAFKEAQALLQNRLDFHLAFNISAIHFKDKDFFNAFKALMAQYGILSAQIVIEITERELIDTNDSIFSETMKALREEGFGLAVDDYGTGHASISYLQHFPFNYLKIDQLFVKAIGTQAVTESLNEAIIQMAKQLNLMIIAEGVETQEQLVYLSTRGVRFFQGWHFSRALSMDQLMRLIHEKVS